MSKQYSSQAALSDESITNAINAAYKLVSHWDRNKAPKKPVKVAEHKELRNNGATLQEVADELGCSRERCRQIEEKALEKLRRYYRRHPDEAQDILIVLSAA